MKSRHIIVLTGSMLKDPSAYLERVEEAVRSFEPDLSVDLTKLGPDEKEEGYLALRAVCEAAFLPVFVVDDYRRLEDVKKVLYAGAYAAVFNLSDPSGCGLYEEAAKRFGKERLGYLAGENRICLEKEPQWNKCMDLSFADLKTDAAGLVPVVVQDAVNSEVLMVAYMNEEAFEKTIKTRRMTYYSRSRKQLWVKGETSGHYQYPVSLSVDCDEDTLLAKVIQIGAACHTGNRSCFYRTVYEDSLKLTDPYKVLTDVYETILDRKANPKEGSYTTYLFTKGIDKILKKLGEENAETIIAAKNPEPEEIIYEISDYLYHMMVLMAEKGIRWEDITEELARRH